MPELNTDHPGGSINGNEQIPSLSLIGHLWQILDIDMNVTNRVVFEALVLRLVVLRARHLPEITHVMSA